MRLTRTKKRKIRMKKKLIRGAFICLIGLACSLAAFSIPETLALLTDRTSAITSGFYAAGFDTVFSLLQGDAAVESPGSGSTPVFNEEIPGLPMIDFREINSAATITIGDVFRLHNKWSVDRQVYGEISVAGGLQQFLQPSPGAFDLNNGETVSCGFEVQIPAGTPAETYNGEIVITALNGFLEKRIPARLTVVPDPEMTTILETTTIIESSSTVDNAAYSAGDTGSELIIAPPEDITPEGVTEEISPSSPESLPREPEPVSQEAPPITSDDAGDSSPEGAVVEPGTPAPLPDAGLEPTPVDTEGPDASTGSTENLSRG